MDKKDLMKDSTVYDFAMQWSMDCMVNMEREPGRYTLKINGTYCNGRGSQASTWIQDDAKGKSGEAVCHVNDKYDFNLGIAVAWAKLHDIPLPKALQPKYYIDIRKITPGEIFLDNITDVDSCDRCIVIANNIHDKDRIITFKNLDCDYYDIIIIPKNKKKRVELA